MNISIDLTKKCVKVKIILKNLKFLKLTVKEFDSCYNTRDILYFDEVNR